ncbi:MAG: metal ABC transporter permease, partial [Fimbriimonadaceae bacterium]|nr:metal ABC transporter permease [Alphaproteobacteria bacterium]
LGIALGVLFDWLPFAGVLMVTLTIAILLLLLQRLARVSTDTLLGILSHGALAFGLVAIGMIGSQRVNLFGYLFGDILAINRQDLMIVFGGGAVILAILAVIWRYLLAITVNEDLARAEGIPVQTVRIIYMLLIAAVIAIAMKIVGILLVTAMLIIPAASARAFASAPESMAFGAIIAGTFAVIGGLFASLQLENIPAGPAIVSTAVVIYALSLVFNIVARRT